MKKTVEQILRDIREGGIKRSMNIEREAIDEESRTVELAFASDKPIDHWFGQLALSMDKKAVRTERLKNGAPLLMDHNTRDQIGVIDGFTLGKDGVARATCRFSRSTRGQEIFQDVVDGIRTCVSVGFMIYEMHLEKQEKDKEDIYRSDDWEPYEISLVSVPADISVGVGRSLEQPPAVEAEVLEEPQEREIVNKEENHMTPEQIAAAERAAEETRKAEMAARRTEVVEFAEIFGEAEMAREMLLASETVTVDDVRTAIKAKRAVPATVMPEPIAPAIQAAREGGIPAPAVEFARGVYRGGQLRAFSGDGGHEAAYRAGKWIQAALLGNAKAADYCREKGIDLVRTQTGTDNAKGGVLVPVEMENAIIDLRIQYGVARRNTRSVPMSSDTKLIPRRVGGLTAYPVGPGQAGTKSTANWDQVELIARKWMVLAKYEDEVSEDSIINMADTLVSEMSYAFTFSEDAATFNGDGSSAYHGIVGIIPKLLGLSGTIANIAGLQVASGNNYSEIVDGDIHGLIGKLPQFARNSGSVKWYCSHTFKSTVLDKLAFAKGGVTVAETTNGPEPRFMGYSVEIVEVMPSIEANSQICLLLGNLSLGVAFGDRRGITVKTTDSDGTDFQSDVLAIKATERFDVNVHDVGNASATAAERKPGPVVGLIMAAS